MPTVRELKNEYTGEVISRDSYLTVAELRELLTQYPDDYAVELEGCDCYGPADGVRELGDDTILITRS